jgi:hypothetical protein
MLTKGSLKIKLALTEVEYEWLAEVFKDAIIHRLNQRMDYHDNPEMSTFVKRKYEKTLNLRAKLSPQSCV